VIANERSRGIYLLAHLHSSTEGVIQRGMRVEPGDLVAYVGRSGTNRQETPSNNYAHLHIEYYDIQYIEEYDINEADRNQYVRVEGTGNNRQLRLPDTSTTNPMFNQYRLRPTNRRNPFDHSNTQQ